MLFKYWIDHFVLNLQPGAQGTARQVDDPDEDSDKFLSSEESELESDEEERQRRFYDNCDNYF